MLVLPESAMRREPWKNGRGMTTGLATDGEPWTWRLAIAEVPSRGEFSVYPGVDRVLSLLVGEGLALEIDGVRTAVPRDGDGVPFRGESRVVGEPVGAAVRDLNVMVQRAVWRARLRLLTGGAHEFAGEVLVVHAWGGAVNVFAEATITRLAPGETLITSGGAEARCEAGATAAIAAMVAAREGWGTHTPPSSTGNLPNT